MIWFYRAFMTRTERSSMPAPRSSWGQAVIIDEADYWTSLYGPPPPLDKPIVTDFYRVQAVKQLVLFAGVVVRRDAYEAVGGFCTSFVHVGDWNMWFRVAGYGPVAQVGRPYSLYREHKSSDTSKLMISAINTTEYYHVISAHCNILERQGETNYDRAWKNEVARIAEESSWRLKSAGSIEGHWNQMRVAWAMEPSMRRLRCLLKAYLNYKRPEKRK
jgi:hypothetical protein